MRVRVLVVAAVALVGLWAGARITTALRTPTRSIVEPIILVPEERDEEGDLDRPRPTKRPARTRSTDTRRTPPPPAEDDARQEHVPVPPPAPGDDRRDDDEDESDGSDDDAEDGDSDEGDDRDD